MINKTELKTGSYYKGEGRGVEVGRWNGKVFIYIRHKWGSSYPAEMPHVEDDEKYNWIAGRYAVFVPEQETTATDPEIPLEVT